MSVSRILLALLAVFFFLALSLFFLPSEYRFSATENMNLSNREVWKILKSPDYYNEWLPPAFFDDLSQIEVKPGFEWSTGDFSPRTQVRFININSNQEITLSFENNTYYGQINVILTEIASNKTKVSTNLILSPKSLYERVSLYFRGESMVSPMHQQLQQLVLFASPNNS